MVLKMKYLSLETIFTDVKEYVRNNGILKNIADDVEINYCYVPLHGGYYKDGEFIDRFGNEETYENASRSEEWKWVNRSKVSLLLNDSYYKGFIVYNFGDDKIYKIEEN